MGSGGVPFIAPAYLVKRRSGVEPAANLNENAQRTDRAQVLAWFVETVRPGTSSTFAEGAYGRLGRGKHRRPSAK